MQYTKQEWRPSRAAIFASTSITLLTMVSRNNIVFGIRAFDSSILVDCADAEIRDVSSTAYLFPAVAAQRIRPNVSGCTSAL